MKSIIRIDLNKKLSVRKILRLNLHLGGNLLYKNKELPSFVIAHRANFFVYNINLLFIKLRKVLLWVSSIAFYNKLLMINTNMVSRKIDNNTLEYLKKLAKKWFLISAHKWIGGSLTNYRNIYKSLYSLLRVSKNLGTIKKLKYREAIKGLLVNRVPKLPAVFVSLGEDHYGLNESRSIGIKTVQFIENDYKDFLLGEITIGSNMNDLSAIVYAHLLKEAVYFGNIKNGVYFDFPVIRKRNKKGIANTTKLFFYNETKKRSKWGLKKN